MKGQAMQIRKIVEKSKNKTLARVNKKDGCACSLTREQVEEKIRGKAYDLFQRRGYTHGGDWNDWFAAEKIVSKELSARQ